jgi:hypothetical protein
MPMLTETLFRCRMMGLLVLLSLFGAGFCGDVETAPVTIQAAIFLKLLAFDKNISAGGTITIYVAGSADFAAEMKKAEGKTVGGATIGKVVEGTGAPSEKPSVIYIGSESSLASLVAFTRGNKILSITGNPDLVAKDVTLGVGVSEGKPKILLNLSASKEEGIDWNPAILKIAAAIK